MLLCQMCKSQHTKRPATGFKSAPAGLQRLKCIQPWPLTYTALHLKLQNKDAEPVDRVPKQSNEAGNQQDLMEISCLVTGAQRKVWQVVSAFETPGASELKADVSGVVERKLMTEGGRKAGIKTALNKKQMLSEKQPDRAWSQSLSLHLFKQDWRIMNLLFLPFGIYLCLTMLFSNLLFLLD